jgi:hypothetical protein
MADNWKQFREDEIDDQSIHPFQYYYEQSYPSRQEYPQQYNVQGSSLL